MDAARICREVIDDLRGGEPTRNVRVNIPPEAWVEADPTLLRVVLLNLLDNAWKFTRDRDPGTVTVTLSEVDGRRWLTVVDDGDGFDPTYKDKLFAPFQRLHHQRDFAGTGIGLAAVGQVAQRHRGQVEIEGRLGEGATVRITLDPAPGSHRSSTAASGCSGPKFTY